MEIHDLVLYFLNGGRRDPRVQYVCKSLDFFPITWIYHLSKFYSDWISQKVRITWISPSYLSFSDLFGLRISRSYLGASQSGILCRFDLQTLKPFTDFHHSFPLSFQKLICELRLV